METPSAETVFCQMCQEQAELAAQEPEIYGEIPQIKEATVFDKWPVPVCAEHDASLDSLGADLAQMEAEDPELARLGEAVRESAEALSAGLCHESGCLFVSYRRHMDGHVMASHVHMDSDDLLDGAIREVNAQFAAKATAPPDPAP